MRLLPLAALLIALILSGCSASAPATRTADGFTPGSFDRLAMVAMQSDVATKNFAAMQADAAATRSAELRVPLLLREYGQHFGVTVIDARSAGTMDSEQRARALAAVEDAGRMIRAQNRAVSELPYAEGRRASRELHTQSLGDLAPEEVRALGVATESRYLLHVAVAGWSASEGEKLLDALLIAGGGLTGALIAGQNQAATVETMVVDTERGEVVWYSARSAVLDPSNPLHLQALTQSVAIELFSGHYLPPAGLNATVNHDAVIYLVDGGRVTGRVRGPDNLYFTVETRDGEQRVPIEQVKSVRGFSGVGKLFPRTN